MDWNNYLLEKKSPSAPWAHLGMHEGEVWCPYDLSELPENSKVIRLPSPLKKFKLNYTNYESLIGNKNIECVKISDLDENRIKIFSTLPNLKCFEISFIKKEHIPDLSSLNSVEVLIISNISKTGDLSFLKNMKNLKTLYIYCMKNLYDLEPLSNLRSLRELALHHGLMGGGTGKPIKGMEPLRNLSELRYLMFCLTAEGRNTDIKPLTYLKKLEYLTLLPKYLKNGQDKLLLSELPLIKTL